MNKIRVRATCPMWSTHVSDGRVLFVPKGSVGTLTMEASNRDVDALFATTRGLSDDKPRLYSDAADKSGVQLVVEWDLACAVEHSGERPYDAATTTVGSWSTYDVPGGSIELVEAVVGETPSGDPLDEYDRQNPPRDLRNDLEETARERRMSDEELYEHVLLFILSRPGMAKACVKYVRASTNDTGSTP